MEITTIGLDIAKRMFRNCLYGVFGVKPFSGGGLDNKLCALHCLGHARRPL